MERAWSDDPESCAGGSVEIGRVSCRTGQSDDPDIKEYSGASGWGLGMGLTTPTHKTYVLLNSF